LAENGILGEKTKDPFFLTTIVAEFWVGAGNMSIFELSVGLGLLGPQEPRLVLFLYIYFLVFKK